jgi:hypothetical protein
MTAEHALRCGSVIFRHDGLKDMLIAAAKREARLAVVHRESSACFHDAYHNTHRMDIVIEGHQMVMPGLLATDAVKGAAIDVAIIDPCSSSYLAQAVLKPGTAAAAKALEKSQHYSTPLRTDSFTFFPLVFELYGTACKETHTFIKALAAEQVKSSGDGWAPSLCVSRWRQRFSTVLQRQISRCMQLQWQRTVAIEGQPPPDVWAFAHTKLLRRAPLLAEPG